MRAIAGVGELVPLVHSVKNDDGFESISASGSRFATFNKMLSICLRRLDSQESGWQQ